MPKSPEQPTPSVPPREEIPVFPSSEQPSPQLTIFESQQTAPLELHTRENKIERNPGEGLASKFPPITGGSQEAKDTPESAREYFAWVFENSGRMWKWGHRTKNKKENQKIVKEMARLQRLYPDVYEEAMNHFGMDGAEWRRQHNQLEKLLPRKPTHRKK